MTGENLESKLVKASPNWSPVLCKLAGKTGPWNCVFCARSCTGKVGMLISSEEFMLEPFIEVVGCRLSHIHTSVNGLQFESKCIKMQGINHLTCKNTATVEAFKSSPDRPNQPQNNEVNPTQEKTKATQHNNDEVLYPLVI